MPSTVVARAFEGQLAATDFEWRFQASPRSAYLPSLFFFIVNRSPAHDPTCLPRRGYRKLN